MIQFNIDEERCIQCGECAEDCPAAVISMDPDASTLLDGNMPDPAWPRDSEFLKITSSGMQWPLANRQWNTIGQCSAGRSV